MYYLVIWTIDGKLGQTPFYSGNIQKDRLDALGYASTIHSAIVVQLNTIVAARNVQGIADHGMKGMSK